MILIAPRSAKLVESYGARVTLLLGYLFCLLAFLTMLLLWDESSPAWHVLLGFSFMGIGVSLAGTPASRSLTGSVPVRRAGMASATADLQRDLGGAILQSVFGALLTAGYASAMVASIASTGKASQISDATQAQLTESYAGAETIAAAVPAVRAADHRGGAAGVPARRQVGLRGRRARRVRRRLPRVLPVPEERRRERAPRRVPRGGRAAPARRAARGSATGSAEPQTA